MAKKRTRAMKIRGLRRPARRHLKRLLKGLSARRLKKRRHTRRRGENPLTRAETAVLIRRARGALRNAKHNSTDRHFKGVYQGMAEAYFDTAKDMGYARGRSVQMTPARSQRTKHGRYPMRARS